jgi:hypothetical protein
MNFPRLIYPGYFIYYPIMMVQSETSIPDVSQSIEPSMVTSPKKNDIMACERKVKGFLELVRQQPAGEPQISW